MDFDDWIGNFEYGYDILLEKMCGGCCVVGYFVGCYCICVCCDGVGIELVCDCCVW